VAWTAPRTWVALEVVSGADLNTVRDNLRYLKGDDAWQLPTLLNSWVAYDAGTTYGGPRYKLIGKVLKMVGLAKSGTVSSTPSLGAMFVLPVGYRPPERMTFAVVSNNLFGRCDVLDTTGEVVAYTGSATWFSVAGIQFPVA
jgi:hypothetical protein